MFERVTGEPFSDTPGVPVTSRVRALAKVMGNLTRAGEGVPPLVAGHRRDLTTWGRVPRQHVDVEAWRQRAELAEQSSQRPVRRRLQMAEADAGLALWLRNHQHLVPVELAVGESGMALLLLWEVDHGCPWPSQAEDTDRSGTLGGFTRRLKKRVAADSVLSAWLQSEDVQRPLSFGLADTHHTRWSLQVRVPAYTEPQGWWRQFRDVWVAYLGTQQRHVPAPPAPPVMPPVAPNPTDIPSSSASSGPQPMPPAAMHRRPRSAVSSARRPRPPRPVQRRPVPPSEASTASPSQPGAADPACAPVRRARSHHHQPQAAGHPRRLVDPCTSPHGF